MDLVNGVKNTETSPKYDPNRPFRKGDKVRAVEYKGRKGTDCPDFTGKIYTVSQEEKSNKLLKLTDGFFVYYIDPAYVKLVTPIEELEPYSVSLRQELTVDDTYPYCAVIDHDGNEVARFYCEQYEEGKARAAAEAERDRLNAEYRKEQK
jgi:hypothetical protein